MIPRSALLALLVLPGLAVAQPRPADDRQEAKCRSYAEAWADALARFGRAGLGAEFLARHDAFVARGCVGTRDVCPRSREELAMADAMTIAAMNARMASSFVPFMCRE
jgi:hypothetical protein